MSIMNPKIHITSMLPEERVPIIEKIKILGGTILDPHHNQFNSQCTHVVICNDTSRPTERVLAALAKGK